MQNFKRFIGGSALAIAAAGSTLILAAPAAYSQSLVPSSDALADIVEDLLPTVVNVNTRGTIRANTPDLDGEDLPESFQEFRDFMERMQPQMERQRSGAGSGFIVSDDFIVTNHHVIEGAQSVRVTLHDGSQYDVEVWASDPATDLAVLKIDADGRDLSEVEWGSSQDTRVGEWLIAIGNPFGLGSTVTAGIVSAKGRTINSGPYDSFIQTDASINRGNSGGPSFNVDGEVVGVNSAIFSPTGASVGIGFAIPSSIAERVVNDLISEREVIRGFIGVSIGNVDQELADLLGLSEASGAIVRNVNPQGPAGLAGVEPGDVIVEFGGQKITSSRDVTRAVADTGVGVETPMTIIRGGQPLVLEVVVGRRTPAALASLSADEDDQAPSANRLPDNPLAEYGLRLAEVSAGELAELGWPQYDLGLMVAELAEGGLFNPGDLRPGDVIVELDSSPVTGSEQLAADIANAIDSGANLLPMIIIRDGQRIWIAPRLNR